MERSGRRPGGRALTPSPPLRPPSPLHSPLRAAATCSTGATFQNSGRCDSQPSRISRRAQGCPSDAAWRSSIAAQLGPILGSLDLAQAHELRVRALGQAAQPVVHVRDAARSCPAPKLRPVLPEHDDHAAGHVLAAVVAHALHHRARAGVAHREALARPARARTARRRSRRRAPCCPRITLWCQTYCASAGGRMTISPPASPLPT